MSSFKQFRYATKMIVDVIKYISDLAFSEKNEKE